MAFGVTFLFAGVISIAFRKADKEQESPSIINMALVFTSLNILFDFLKNLCDAPSDWRDMKTELSLLGIGVTMSVAGIILLVR